MSQPLENTNCVRCDAPLPVGAESCPSCLWSMLSSEISQAAETLVISQIPERRHQMVGGCILLEKLGEGGMGVVWRAQQVAPARQVALKMIKAHPVHAHEFRARFELEARALAVLDHPAILPLFEYGEEDDCLWFTMKLAPGGTLSSRRPALAGKWRAIAGLIRKLAVALQYAHDRGVLHRDLKPANVLFDAEGEPCIADFGLAKLMGETSVLDGSLAVLGTPAYLAPEIATADARAATTASDVYGLGATFYELLAGAPPYATKALHAMLQEISSTDPSPPSRRANQFSTIANVPRDLDIICMKCLARDPARRYASARALADDLERWLDGRPITARNISGLERTWAWARRNPVVAGLAALLIVSLTIGSLMLWLKNRDLNSALQTAKAARKDADKEIDFMTKDLGGKMQSLGQLSLLSDVFANIGRYHDRQPLDLSDHEAMDRRIHFHLKSGEILLPQGKASEAIEQYKLAAHWAAEAAKAHPSESHFRLLEAQSFQKAAAAAMESSGDKSAESYVQQALQRLENLPGQEAKSARAAALNIASRAASHFKKTLEGERFALQSIALCRELVQSNPGPNSQTELATALENLGVVLKGGAKDSAKEISAASKQDMFTRALAAFQEMRDLYASACKETPEFLPWQYRLSEAHNWMASVQREQKAYDAARANLARQREIMDPLITAEPLNGQWQVELVLNAWAEGQISKALDDENGKREWRQRQLDILSRLLAQYPSVRQWWLHYQVALQDEANELEDAEAALKRRMQSVTAGAQALWLHASSDDLVDLLKIVRMVHPPASGEAIAFQETVSQLLVKGATRKDGTAQDYWWAAAACVQMKLALLHFQAGEKAPAETSYQNALTYWQRAVELNHAPMELGRFIRSEGRAQMELAEGGPDPVHQQRMIKRWLDLPQAASATFCAASGRAGWFRFMQYIGEEWKSKQPAAWGEVRQILQTYCQDFQSGSPLTDNELKEARKLTSLLE